jgi:hypothetical protein
MTTAQLLSTDSRMGGKPGRTARRQAACRQPCHPVGVKGAAGYTGQISCYA